MTEKPNGLTTETRGGEIERRDRYAAALDPMRHFAAADGDSAMEPRAAVDLADAAIAVADAEQADLRARITELEQQAAAVQPPADRDLRDRIAQVLADADGWTWAGGAKEVSPTWRGYQQRADAVLAVLPAPADRSTVLGEALAAAEAVNARYPYGCSATAVIDELRRMADEAQQAGEA
ncbi:hypothetical protein [Streptomyces sp. NPDC018584]|uniref:hypothetical protein n=1 Tax=unclassified Streptomyces TaxID=2593676 RepID=UPI0037AC7D8F